MESKIKKKLDPAIHTSLSLLPCTSSFSQEKVYDKITKYYFRSTKHHDKDSLQQILLKLNRLER